jgi:hypothetical protein
MGSTTVDASVAAFRTCAFERHSHQSPLTEAPVFGRQDKVAAAASKEVGEGLAAREIDR